MTDIGIHQVESVEVTDDQTYDGLTKWTHLLVRTKDGSRVKITFFPAGDKHVTITRKIEETV